MNAPDHLSILRSRFAVPGTVAIDPDANGLPRIVISTPNAEAHIYLHGAHVTHYQPRGAPAVLFMSRESYFAPGKPIRGGVPIIFPWFGPHPTDATKPAHGWARTAQWTLDNVAHDNLDCVRVILSLAADGYALTYVVEVGRELAMELTVRNTTAVSLTLEEALHTYVAVSNVRQARIDGLDGRQYLDKVDAMQRKTQSGPITITGETDRVYLDTPDEVKVHDDCRRLVVSKEGSASTVVWNPWVEKAKKMPDFGDDEWPRMLCVETANAADNAITLAPGAAHVMRAALRVG